MPPSRIPIQTTPAGFNPSPNGPQASNALNTAPTPDQQNLAVFQAGADAVTGKNTNTFSVMRYPQDLATPEQPHYVMFYVNVRKSTLSSSEQKSNISSANFDSSANNTVPSEAKAIGGLSAAVGGTGGANAGTAVAGALGTSILGPPFAVVGFAAGVAYTRSAAFKDQVQSDTKVLLKDVIALYLSGKPSVQYSASWADVDIGLAGRLGEKFGQVLDDLSPIGDDISRFDFKALLHDAGPATSAAWKSLMSGTSGIAANLILKSADKSNGALGNFGAALQASAAIVPNPFKAQLFHTMGFRTFNFDYTFLPKNAQEYAQVKKIINTFKKHMHPSFGGDKYIMRYPAEWNIAYYYKGGANSELFRIANCALTNCKVEYGGTDFTTFKRIPGAPTEISMQLSFVELELLTKERVEAGF